MGDFCLDGLNPICWLLALLPAGCAGHDMHSNTALGEGQDGDRGIDYSINGNVVNRDEWESFLELLRTARPFIKSGASIEQIAEDSNITECEIDRFLDGDGDGTVTYYDFNYKPSEYQKTVISKDNIYTGNAGIINAEWNRVFSKLNDVLGRHGYDVVSRSGILDSFEGEDPKIDVPGVFMTVPEVLLEAYKLTGFVIGLIPEDLMMNRELALEIMKYDWHAIFDLSEYHGRDVDMLAMAVMNNHLLMDELVPEDLREEVWKRCIEYIEEACISVPDELESYEDLKPLRESHGILVEDNFPSLATLFTVISNRIIDEDDDRPLALIISANGSDAVAHADDIELLVKSGIHRVLYYEVSTCEDEVYDIINKAYESHGRKIHTIEFIAHGTAYGMQFGNDLSLDRLEKLNIDIHDFGHMKGGKAITIQNDNFGDLIYKVMDPDGQIILTGCSTGQGGFDMTNLANAFAKFTPCGVTIFSQMKNGALRLKAIDPNGSVSIASTAKTYIAHGQKDCE